VADNYGVWMYGLVLFLLTIWWGRQWGEATACPYTYLEDMLEGRSNYGVAILKTVSGLMGALVVFKSVFLC
jgi:aquaporin related protein